MPSRMDRYKDSNKKDMLSRSNKNQELYENIGSNTRYTNFTDVTNANAIDISQQSTNYRTREGYHRLKEYNPQELPTKEKKELDDFNYLYQDRENKIYDVNKILEEAHKNRDKNDNSETKRNLKNDSYNIIKNLNPEELEKYRKERVKRPIQEDEEEIRELIDTITSKTLAGEIDKATSVDLLSDLMATNILDKVGSMEDEEKDETESQKSEEIELEKTEEIDENELSLSKEVLDKEQLEKIREVKDKEPPKEKNLDEDFYTGSMELSKNDFETTDDFTEEKTSTVFKVFSTIIILIALLVIAYFVWQNH